jgi:L-iditol 2-dehydrogenase
MTETIQQSKKKPNPVKVPDTMKACLFYGPGDIRYETVETPKINENEVLVKIQSGMTCGTDLKTFKRGHPVLIKTLPSAFGHQFSGIVADVGNNVKNFHEGQRIVAVNTAPCFNCFFCKKSEYSLCENLEFLNGAYGEYIALPERIVKYNTYEIPEEISFEEAAMLETFSVVMHGFEKSKISSGMNVCVVGTGAIGLIFAALSRLAGANVISIGRTPDKLNLAKELGARSIINMDNFEEQKSEIIGKVRELTSGYGPDVVIEAVGLPETWVLATELVRKGGLVNFFGGCKKGVKIEIDTYKLHYGETKLVGVFHHTPHHVKKALDFMRDKNKSMEIFKKLITHKIRLEKLKDAFILQESGKAVQIAIIP